MVKLEPKGVPCFRLSLQPGLPLELLQVSRVALYIHQPVALQQGQGKGRVYSPIPTQPPQSKVTSVNNQRARADENLRPFNYEDPGFPSGLRKQTSTCWHSTKNEGPE